MARVRITNAHDMLRAARGEIRADSVHRIEREAQTDDGAAMVLLSHADCRTLGLAVRGSRRVLYSDGREANLASTASVVLELAGRHLVCEALVEPERTVPLVGGSALEALEFTPGHTDSADFRRPAPPLGTRTSAQSGTVPRRSLWTALCSGARDLLRALIRKRWGFSARMTIASEHGPTTKDFGSAGCTCGMRSGGPAERSRPMNGIDETIERVESLYRSLTGREPPVNGGLGIPPEKDPSQHVTEQVERLLGALAPATQPATVAVSPSLSVWESATETRICVEMPGATRESVRLSIANNTLTVAATQPPADQGFALRLSERPSGEFRRTIPLPTGVAESDIRAQMRDGILEITFPRTSTVLPTTKPIPVA